MVDNKHLVTKDASFCFTQNSEGIQHPASSSQWVWKSTGTQELSLSSLLARKAPPGEPLWKAARSKLVCKCVVKPFVLTKNKLEILPCSDTNQRGPEDGMRGRMKGRVWCSWYNAQVHVLPALFLARFSGTEKWFVWRSSILLCLNKVFGKVLVIHGRIKPSEP